MCELQVHWRVRQEPVYPWEHEKNKSGFIIKHQNEKHNVEPPEFKWKVLKTFRDPG